MLYLENENTVSIHTRWILCEFIDKKTIQEKCTFYLQDLRRFLLLLFFAL